MPYDELRFELSSASFEHCCGRAIKPSGRSNVKQLTRRSGTFL
jgi:hypothetical protein